MEVAIGVEEAEVAGVQPPSCIASVVARGFCQYSRIALGPRTTISPSWPGGTVWPEESTTRISHCGIGRPAVVFLVGASSMGKSVTLPPASVRP